MSLLLAMAILLGLAPAVPGQQAQAHWSDAYLNQLVEWGFIRSDQASAPTEELTRADFMSIVNRAYGYHVPGETPFTDVKENDWYYDDVGIAYTAKYIKGTSPTTVSPQDTLTRETAATILGRNMMLQESAGEILGFTDARDISSWPGAPSSPPWSTTWSPAMTTGPSGPRRTSPGARWPPCSPASWAPPSRRPGTTPWAACSAT